MAGEFLTPPQGLEERLRPVLTFIRANPSDGQTNYEFVQSWFGEHEENLATDIQDLTFLCTLPSQERKLVAYPVIGNWVLSKMDQFTPQSTNQQEVFSTLRELVSESRFKNDHTEGLYDKEEFAKKRDNLGALMLQNPEVALPVHNLLKGISREVAQATYDMPHNDAYTIDLGHGLWGPVDHMTYLTWHFSVLQERGQTEPLDLTIMVVDDREPKEWYERLVAAGFKDSEDQQGFFSDGESALEALENGRYDVILSDIDLGEGRMDGITFVKQAYEIQQRNGIPPMISVFSSDKNRLKQANDELRRDPVTYETLPFLFQSVDLNYKGFFTAVGFREDVSYTLYKK